MVVAAVVGMRWYVRSVWDLVDRPAAQLRAPSGFRLDATERYGSSNCFVTCVGGGEPVVTKIYSTRADPTDACEFARKSLLTLKGIGTIEDEADATQSLEADCAWRADLPKGASVRASVDLASGLKLRLVYMNGDGPRPRGPVVVSYRFFSGVE